MPIFQKSVQKKFIAELDKVKLETAYQESAIDKLVYQFIEKN
jgi:hypothetical protein